MKHFELLEDFIKNNSDWEIKIKPYMKSMTPVENTNWIVLMYNLMDMPDEEYYFKLACLCRGTVVDRTTGEIICAPFTKFWNYGDGPAAKIDWDSAWVSHKRDGWIYKAFKYNNKIYWMSNGRVITENEPGAPVDYIPGKERLDNMSAVLRRAIVVSSETNCNAFWDNGFLTSDDDWCKRIPNGTTVMFELESPWNRIHTDLVSDAKLWLIGCRLPSGDEITINDAKKRFGIPYELPKIYSFHDADTMLSVLSSWTVKNNGEGVVVCDKNFNRVKVKINDYIRIKFESRGEDFGDNRLFKYYCQGEVDDLCSANPSVKARVNEISKNCLAYKKYLDKKVDFVNNVLAKRYADKKEFFMSVSVDFPEDGNFYKTLYGRTSDEIFAAFKESGKTKKTAYTDMLKRLKIL